MGKEQNLFGDREELCRHGCAVFSSGPVPLVVQEEIVRPGGRFGAAMERARSLSRSREQEQEGQLTTWAGITAAGAQVGLKRTRQPGDKDADGFIVPGRPVRKVVPNGSSKVDLSGLGGVMVAPIDRYIGNTDLRVTKEMVMAALTQCAAGLEGKPALEIEDVVRINRDLPNARTAAWKVTVPYKHKDLMNNPELYPPGWTHRAYFAPRGENTKRPRHEGGRNSAMVENLIQEDGRLQVRNQQSAEDLRVKRLIEAGIAAGLASAGVSAGVSTGLSAGGAGAPEQPPVPLA